MLIIPHTFTDTFCCFSIKHSGNTQGLKEEPGLAAERFSIKQWLQGSEELGGTAGCKQGLWMCYECSRWKIHCATYVYTVSNTYWSMLGRKEEIGFGSLKVFIRGPLFSTGIIHPHDAQPPTPTHYFLECLLEQAKSGCQLGFSLCPSEGKKWTPDEDLWQKWQKTTHFYVSK